MVSLSFAKLRKICEKQSLRNEKNAPGHYALAKIGHWRPDDRFGFFPNGKLSYRVAKPATVRRLAAPPPQRGRLRGLQWGRAAGHSKCKVYSQNAVVFATICASVRCDACRFALPNSPFRSAERPVWGFSLGRFAGPDCRWRSPAWLLSRFFAASVALPPGPSREQTAPRPFPIPRLWHEKPATPGPARWRSQFLILTS